MTNPKGLPRFPDPESRPPLADIVDAEADGQHLASRLGDLWSDYVRGVNAGRDPDTPRKSSSSLPILDDMKGILQWE